MSDTIAFIGAGNMARSLAGGLLQQGWPAAAVRMADPNKEQLGAARKAFDIAVFADNAAAARGANILVLAVKPQTLRAVCTALRPALAHAPLAISVAAGIRAHDIARWLGGGCAVVRTMPNTPALIGQGATALFAHTGVTAAQRTQAENIMRAVGIAEWVADEAALDAVTALSGSGPAYFFRVIEVLEQAGIAQGLPPATARRLSIQTALGAASMAAASDEAPAVLRARVTSPGGTTERALATLDEGHIAELFARAVAAARARSQELAEEFGKE